MDNGPLGSTLAAKASRRLVDLLKHCQSVLFSHVRIAGQLLGRPLLSFALVLVFGIYGIVYLLRLRGAVSYRGERIFYTTMNFTTKLFASMTLSGIRSSEFQEVLLTMLANTQTSFKRAVNYEETAELLP